MLIKEGPLEEILDKQGQVSDHIRSIDLISRSPHEGAAVAGFIATDIDTVGIHKLNYVVVVQVCPVFTKNPIWVDWFLLGANRKVEMRAVNESFYIRFLLGTFDYEIAKVGPPGDTRSLPNPKIKVVACV